jgi:hypothetical protein
MRKLFLFIYFGISSVGLLFSNAVSFPSESVSDTQDSRTETIDLHGSFSRGDLRPGFVPFQASKNSLFITVDYLHDISLIKVSIVDDYGESVYNNKVNSVVCRQLLIDISTLPEGRYLISFTNSNGEVIYGEFQISNRFTI